MIFVLRGFWATARNLRKGRSNPKRFLKYEPPVYLDWSRGERSMQRLQMEISVTNPLQLFIAAPKLFDAGTGPCREQSLLTLLDLACQALQMVVLAAETMGLLCSHMGMTR